MDHIHTNTSGNINPPPTPFLSDFSFQDFLDQELNFHPHTLTTNLSECSPNINTSQFCPILTQQAESSNYFNNDFNSPTMSCTNNNNYTRLNSFSGIDHDMVLSNNGDQDDDYDDEEDNNSGEAEHSSATNTTNTTTTTTTTTNNPNQKAAKGDRSRTLISERRRRGRMKEKLYALRALVPNITKMDKASIVGDAVLYLQDLQTQAKKLRSQIQGFESSLKAADICQGVATQKKNSPLTHFLPECKIIMQMEVLPIEDKEFYVKVVSNKGQGVAASLYKALESFTNFTIQNSNLNTVCERFILTFTLNAQKCREDMNVPNLKLWMTGAFLSQGFNFQPF